jgi:chemotaxis protein methyltransferase WspC
MNAPPERSPRPTRRDSAAWQRVAALAGLAPELLVTPGLDRWIEDRSRTLAVDPHDYVDRLLADESERRRFASQIAVPESWLGRYPASMDVVRDLATHVRARGGVFRAISIGCAAGQELISVALAARDAGVPDHALELHGVDRNAEAIDRARSGLLPTLAVRADLPEAWRADITREADGWRVGTEVHRSLRFHDADVLHDPWPIEAGSADLVLCRNVLIYLDPTARRTLVRRAAALVAPGGLLLAGHADPPADLREAFRPLDRPGAFAWRPIGAVDQATSGVVARRAADSDRRVARPVRPRRAEVGATVAPPAAPATTPDLLAEIRRLADAGDLDAARARAESIAVGIATDAALESLLGEIASADGRLDDARAHWRRALYLDPAHAETLVHLTLLCESQGDAEAALGYRRRLERLGTDTEFES